MGLGTGTSRRRRFAVRAVTLAAALSACSSGDDAAPSTTGPAAAPTATTASPGEAQPATSIAAPSEPSPGIPESAAVDAVVADMAGNPTAAPVAAACTAMSAESSAVAAGLDDESSAGPVIARVAEAVRPIDGAVADALAAASSADAASWCIDQGFAN